VSPRKRWTEVRDARHATEPEAAAGLEAARDHRDAEIATHARTLAELRRARQMTQVQLAKALGVSQAQVSRLEHQADLYVSTFCSYVEAMGGTLDLAVIFGDGTRTRLSLDDLFAAKPDTESAAISEAG
jgi:DNA-binding XRE family transcriptional regulator